MKKKPYTLLETVAHLTRFVLQNQLPITVGTSLIRIKISKFRHQNPHTQIYNLENQNSI